MANLSASSEKAFGFLQEACKQLLTLSTGIVGLTVTFFKEFSEGPDRSSRTLIQCSWVLFVVSIVAGLICLFCLTGQLTNSTPNIKSRNISITAGAQQVLFAVALILAVLAGINAVGSVPSHSPSTSTTTTQSPPTPT